MRKKIIGEKPEGGKPEGKWLDLEQIARAEVTSEDPAHPVEGALIPGLDSGWRASEPGEQVLLLRFDRPQKVARIHLEFGETGAGRTQEFVLCWSSDHDGRLREIVRQQFNFNPGGSSVEVEDYHVALAGVTVLELKIVPDIGGGEALASLKRLRVA